jgi:phosphonate dehydrogenase
MKPRVVITNRCFPETTAYLAPHAEICVNPGEEPWSAEELAHHIAAADALIAFMTDRIDSAFLDQAPRLKIVAAALKGYDNIDVEAAAARGVWVTIVPDLLTVPTAELAIALMLGVARHIRAGDAQIRAHGFAGWRPRLYGRGLAGETVGILGFGSVGRAIAERLRGFGCRLLAHDVAPPPAGFDDVTFVDVAGLLAQSAYVVLALPLNEASLHLIDAEALAAMRPDAFLINPARGSLVDEAAVAAALAAGRLAGYAADVFACEDWARDDRPRGIPAGLTAPETATLLTPHIGSAVVDIRRQIERAAAESVLDVFAGRTPQGAVNRPRTRSGDDQPPAYANLSRRA